MFLMIVLTSIGCLCMETLPSLRVPLENNPQPFVIIYDNATEATITELDNQMTNNRKLRDILTTQPHPVLEQLDSFCTCFFTIEFIVRLIAAPDRISFWKSPMNIIDVLCVLPMWIKYIMLLSNVSVNMKLLAVYFLIMMLRVLRICRVLRMARHYTAVKILLLALKASLRELLMLLIFVFIVVLIFSVIIYYAEFFEEDTFQSIPHGYWWAIITLTTVGYGDMYPKSVMGYLVGAMCALTGILATGLPVPIIANNFNLYYGHALLKDALDHNRKIKSERRKEQELAMMMMIERASENDKEGKCIVKEEAV
ncbi:Potassium voltage-gated channel subfamily C member 4 [Lamellibrachia satsuma]|nr:Potassium voltage-gated channel subfamily C member 4 [Lamellibrachia satsuma]